MGLGMGMGMRDVMSWSQPAICFFMYAKALIHWGRIFTLLRDQPRGLQYQKDSCTESLFGTRHAKALMVLGIITAVAACPAIVGTTEAIRQGQKQNTAERHRSAKSNLIVSCASPSWAGRYIDGRAVVLRDNKVRSSFFYDGQPSSTRGNISRFASFRAARTLTAR